MLVYYVGCMATYRLPSIAKSTIEILKESGIDFTVLGDKEWCCGSVALRTGHIDIAKKLAEHNVEEIKKLGVDRVVTACAGCYRTFKVDYPELLGTDDLGFEVLHVPELLHELIETGKVELQQLDKTVTFHDPCHIGRHMDLYEIPRVVLQKVPGLELVEMERNKENARCCGAGGGVRSAFRDLSRNLADRRLEDAEETKAEILTTACPFCTYNLREAVDRNGTDIEMLDLPELFVRLLRKKSRK